MAELSEWDVTVTMVRTVDGRKETRDFTMRVPAYGQNGADIAARGIGDAVNEGTSYAWKFAGDDAIRVQRVDGCVSGRRADGAPLPPTCCGGWVNSNGGAATLCDPCPPAPLPRISDVQAAVVPLIRAQTLREYADRRHYVDHSRWPMSTFGAAPTPYCACGKTWPEGGCTERRNLIADAATPLPPASDEFNAQVAQALRQLDGSTASAVALLTGMSRDEIDQVGGVGSKPVHPDVDMATADRLWAEIENAPPMPAGWCTWHQMADCAGDAPGCREARVETAGRSTEGTTGEVSRD